MAFSQAAYEALVGEIFHRFPSVQKVGFAGAYKPGLRNMEEFAEALGHPERDFRSIHVAGTNGKGSVANMLASVISATGTKTGLYTSPHIVDFRERARIASPSEPVSMVPKEYVHDFLSSWMPYFIDHQLSFFEITTALAFKWFSDSKVEVAVIEAGLGGRLDSTNVILPELAIVTSIGLDHCALLGDTLAAIAREKAGIFKDGVPAVVGESGEETDPVFNDASWMKCPLTYADKVKPTLWNRRAEITAGMDLRAEPQEHNLRTVLAALDILRGRPGFGGLADEGKVIDAICHTADRMDFHGRWERLSDNPYVLCDIGHNAHALKHNFAQLQRYVAEGVFSSLIIVYGIMADKDLDSIIPLMPSDGTYIFTAPDNPRALPGEEILRRFEAAGGKRAYSASTVREAVQMALYLAQNLSTQLSRSASASKPVPPLVYIGGSTFVVSEAIPIFKTL